MKPATRPLPARATRRLLLRARAFRALATLLAFAALPAPAPLPAQTTHITDDTTIENSATTGFALLATSTTYEIADGKTLSFVQTGGPGTAGAMFNLTLTGAGAAAFTIGPDHPGGTGAVLFENIVTSGQGGVFFLNPGNNATAILDLANATFRGNHTTNNVSGVIHIQNQNVTARFTNALFDGNYSMSAGITGGAGVSRNNGRLEVNSGTFLGNYAALGSSGVVDMNANNTANQSLFTNVLFDSNRAAFNAGVARHIGNNPNSSRIAFTDSEFTGNWAGVQGGVIYNTFNAGNTSPNVGVFFIYTAAGGAVHDITGNAAGYAASGSATQAEVVNNAPLGAPQAKAGGFLFATKAQAANAAINRTGFIIDAGVTVNIGDPAATDKALDSLATGTDTPRIEKSGAGSLILNADNSYWSGTVLINEGRLLLGNAGAQLGGVITVANGATFGGSGTLQTFSQADVALVTSASFAPGSTLQIGADAATGGESLAMVRTGASRITLAGGVTLKFDLFAADPAAPDAAYDRLIADQFVAGAGVNTIDLTGIGAGSYTLISAASFTGDETHFDCLVNGGALTARNTVALETTATTLLLHSTLASLPLLWTGADSGLWVNTNAAAPNWTDGDAAAPETRFRPADHVTFDSAADAANPARRAITIAPEGVTVSGLLVTGTGGYTFAGGPVTVNPAAATPGFTAATGILEKTGPATLTLANSANNFRQITLAGGTLAFTTAAQLGGDAAGPDAAPAPVAVTADAALRAANTAALTLANTLSLAPGKTLVLDTAGAALALAGDLSAVAATGTLLKTGPGALILAADYSALAAAARVNSGTLLLAGPAAAFGGPLAIAPGATLAGAGALAGAVTLSPGATLLVGSGTGATGQALSINTLALQGATIRLALYDDDTADRLDITTLAAPAGANTIDIAAFKPGARRIATVASGDPVALDALAALPVTIAGMSQGGARQIITLSASSGNLLAIGTGDISRAMLWTGAGADPALWDATTANWAGSASTATFAGGDRVTFDDTASPAARDITIPGLRALVSDITVAGAGGYTFSGGAIVADPASLVTGTGEGNITGATARLLKTGPGALTLANSENTFPGGIDLQAGVLAFTTAAQLGDPGGGGAAAAPLLIATATLRPLADAALANPVALAAGAAAAIDLSAASLALSGGITGAGTLATIGAGTLTLSGSNTFSGLWQITGNTTLAITAAGALGTGAVAGASAAAALALDAAGGVGYAVSNLLTGTLAIEKTGAGAVTLDAPNTFSGPVAITAGTLAAATPAALGAGDAAVTIAPGAALQIRSAAADAADLAFARALSGAGTLEIALASSSGQFSLASAGNSAFTGTLRMTRGALRLDATAAAALAAPASALVISASAVAEKTAGGDLAVNLLALDGGRLNLPLAAGAPDGLLTAATLDTGAGLTQIGVDPARFDTADRPNPAIPPAVNLLDQEGFAHVRLIAAGTVTGAGDVVLVAPDGSALPAVLASVVQTGSTAATTGTVATASYSHGTSVQAGGIYMGHGLARLDVAAGKTLVLDNTGAADSTLDAVLAGGGGLEVTATGALTLARQNTLAGPVLVAAGTLRAGAGDILAQSSALEIAAGAAFALNGYAQTVQNLAGTGSILLGAGGTLTVQNTAGTTFSGALSGGRLVKTGSARLTLAAAGALSGVELAAGALGLAAQDALGAGALAVTGPGAALALETGGLLVPNAIGMGGNGLAVTLAPAATGTLSGVISGSSAFTYAGAGTLALTGNNTYSGGLAVAAGRLVVPGRKNGHGAGGDITVLPGAVLEYRDIGAGGDIGRRLVGGGALEITGASTVRFTNAHDLALLRVGPGASVSTNRADSLGGPAAALEIAAGGTLAFGAAGAAAQSLSVAGGGVLVLGAVSFSVPALKLAGPAAFDPGATLALAAPVTGERILIEAASFAGLDSLVFDPGPNDVAHLNWRDGKLRATLVNMAANPGKDIAAAYDAMLASAKAVYSRLAEELLLPLAENRRGLWMKFTASLADYDAAGAGIAAREETRAALVGYDASPCPGLLLGFYIGHSTIDIKSDNLAANHGAMPHAGAYAGLRRGSLYFLLDGMAGSLNADTHRYESVGDATGSYKAAIAAASLEIGGIMNQWPGGAIRPAFALHLLRAAYGSQTETGPAAFYVDDFTASRIETCASLQVSQKFTAPWGRPALFDFSLGWRAALRDEAPVLSATFSRTAGDRFPITCAQYRRDAIVAGLGLRADLGKAGALGLAYDYEITRDITRHTLAATLRWTW